jgi:alanine-glyoxylate transaminase/serine-glyoxylate transaminase/serine-pyruvate transaminase
VAWGAGVPVAEFERRLGADTNDEIKAVFVTHNETATGVVSDVAAVRRALDECFHDALLFVDGVSSIASIDFRMDDWGVDLAVTGSQKGLMCPAGLGILGVSQRRWRPRAHPPCAGPISNSPTWLKLNADGYFPYTPPTPLLRGCARRLDRLFREGLDEVIARHARIAEGVRRGVHAWGLELVAEHPSLLLRHRFGHPRAPGRGCPRRAAHRLRRDEHELRLGSGAACRARCSASAIWAISTRAWR